MLSAFEWNLVFTVPALSQDAKGAFVKQTRVGPTAQKKFTVEKPFVALIEYRNTGDSWPGVKHKEKFDYEH